MKYVDKIAWIHIQDRKVLVARSKNKEFFYEPGGKREPGESDEQALIREAKEEVDAQIIADSIKYLGTFHAKADIKDLDIQIKLTCYTANYSGQLKAQAEIEEIDWFDYSNYHKMAAVSKKVIDHLKEKDLID